MAWHRQDPDDALTPGGGRRLSGGTALLVLAFLCLVCWQGFEHARAVRMAQAALRNRTRDITNSLGVILRSQARFGFIAQARLEAALGDIVNSEEVLGIAVLNQSGEPTARAGNLAGLEPDPGAMQGERWDTDSVTFVNLVEIGMTWEGMPGEGIAPIILPPGPGDGGPGPPPFPGAGPPPFPGGRPAGAGPPPFPGGAWRDPFTEQDYRRVRELMHGEPLSPAELDEAMAIFGKVLPAEEQRAAFRAEISTGPLDDQRIHAANTAAFRAGGGPGRGPFTEEELRRVQELTHGNPLSSAELDEVAAIFGKVLFSEEQRAAFRAEINAGPLDEQRIQAAMGAAFRAGIPPGGQPRPLFHRPPWLSDRQYEELRASRSAHWFVLALSNRGFRDQVSRDRRLRLLVLVAGGCALLAAGFAMRANRRSRNLRMRLVRAMDMNAHLRDMNVAAAGLVHETKNPLNVMRGIAQMIAKDPEATGDMRSSAVRIAEEVDRVAGRLNQFIDYSRPLEVKLAPTDPGKLAESVHRVLSGDFDEQEVAFNLTGPAIVVEADEAMLRQVLFNLLLNAAQALGGGGLVEVRIKRDRDTATLEVCDSGPGVPAESREDIFRPYLSLGGGGSGLGLAVVRQIVLAHQWEITCGESPLGGASFRITGMTVA